LKKPSDPHRPIPFGKYREIHETVTQQFIDNGFVESETLEFTNELPRVIRLSGEMSCCGNILITIDKYLRIQGDAEGDNALVSTYYYTYNASVQGCGNFLRYDNTHSRPGHPDCHHKHVMDWHVKDERDDPNAEVIWVGRDSWPTLGRVIQEVQEWYWLNREELPSPDTYSRLGLRVTGRNPDKADLTIED
jgi:hypothetical protein